MARALIVGCGCRGRLLGGRLLESGWAVRGTSRRQEGLAPIGDAGIEPALAEPASPGTVLDLIGDVTVVLWMLGSARAEPDEAAALHGPALERVLERLVETPVRGFVYEAAGSIDRGLLETGEEAVRTAARTWRVPLAVVAADPGDPLPWADAALDATLGLTS